MLPELDNYDWAEAFGEGSGGNCDGTVLAAIPGDTVDLSPVLRENVAEIIAMQDGENDGPAWVGVFRLVDGRFAFVEASCDYTGWNCRASNLIVVANTLADIKRFGCGDHARFRLFGGDDA